ncbi:hypothetical protein HPB48_010638 [Haemaphysalis longicornis]|uniref:Receptor ligand binding region domain-containing protein n=1 Tax=Haemaphysalis longicornis TaxID=44386 RepID=A0A9J6FYN7_HAELO|nr:hypothetical protein HPB48_010638 [Haemaphysalis longicornis]
MAVYTDKQRRPAPFARCYRRRLRRPTSRQRNGTRSFSRETRASRQHLFSLHEAPGRPVCQLLLLDVLSRLGRARGFRAHMDRVQASVPCRNAMACVFSRSCRLLFYFAVLTLMFFEAVDSLEHVVGVIMVSHSEENRFDIQRIGPAIDIAAEETCRQVYETQLRLTPAYYPHRCSARYAIGRATDLVESEQHVTAFVGPSCSSDLHIVESYAGYRHIPIVTGLGDSFQRTRGQTSTLIRTSYVLRDKARAILAFLGHFQWRNFGIVYRDRNIYYEALFNELTDLAEGLNMTITCKRHFLRNEKTKVVMSDLRAIMADIKECSRGESSFS